MTEREIHVLEDPATLHRDAAEKIADTLENTLRARATVTFVLTGGNTPKPVYEILAGAPYCDRIPWERVDFFWGDERCVPPEHPESNFGMAWSSLLSRVPVSRARIHRMLGELEDHEQAALHYESEIRRAAPLPDFPCLDLALLGMGEDGHTASLFPGTEWDEERCVVANYVPRLKATRISMTPKLLNGARAILFLVTGAAKASVLADVLENPRSGFPAAHIRPRSGSILWLVDRAAASQLSSKSRQ